MTQPSLFANDSDQLPDARPDRRPRSRMARATDPETSHQAAAQFEVSGAASRHHKLILAALARENGLTSEEIAQVAGLDRVAAARRMKELERAGAIRRGPSRKSSGSKRPGVTWFLCRRVEGQ